MAKIKEHRLTVRIPNFIFTKMEKRKNKTTYSYDLQVLEALRKDEEINKY